MRKIFKFQAGTTPNWYAQSSMWDPLSEKTKEGQTPKWYKSIYWNAPYNETAQASLNEWTPELNNTYASQNLRDNDHGHAADLYTAFQKNKAYTDNYKSVGNDIQSFYNTDGNKMSAEDFVKFYNENAEKIRQYWTTPKVYGSLGAKDHNQRFRKMFASRSNVEGNDPWNIGYQEDLEDENGSSTWLRRMDRYEKDFDFKGQIPQSRLHTITLGDGTTATVYKKANGDIALYKTPSLEEEEDSESSGRGVPEDHNTKKSINWDKAFLPNLIEAGRLVGGLNNNEKVYQASLAGIHPNLAQSYNTHRQVVGDEGTKQSYYKMAAQGQSRAARPLTSDADKQMAYMMEAKRIGDELRAKGDLADNTEIRRTSDESNQHQWANTQRNTEVANANVAQLNAANAAKQNLLANKYTADWTSWDTYLKGKEYRMRSKQAENDALEKQIKSLEYQVDLSNDSELAKLKAAASDAYDEDPTSQDYINKLNAYKKYKIQKMINYYQNLSTPLLSAKSGMKVTYKKKDDLLYKSAKDAVEHFRKMAKMSDDSIQKSRKDPVKLSSYPKSKKMQQGGVAPFTVFTPVALGGETSKQVTATSSSEKSKSSDKNESLELAKSLFRGVEGLPIDVDTISTSVGKLLQKASAFGDELSSDDIATMYLKSMQQLNRAKHSKEVYDQAKKIAIDNDAMGEFAVTSSGQYIVQDSSGKIGIATLDEIKTKKLNPLTNGQLINMREISPNLAFGKGDALMETVISNGIGMTKIAEQLTKLKGTLGSSESTIEGYTKHQTNEIKKGLELLSEAPKGTYKYTQYTKDQQEQMKQAYSYIVSMLPKNMKAVLTINAYNQGTSPDKIISALLNAGSSNVSKLEFDAVTGKGSKGSGESGESKFKYDAASALISGEGYSEVMEFNTGTSYAVKVNGRHTEFQKHSGENMGQCTMDEALQSTLKGVLDFNKATFGGSRLNSAAYNHILINDGTVVGVDLPINSSGNPDFSMLKKLQTLDQVLLKKNIEDTSDNAQLVNAACQEVGLPAKYTNDGKLNPYSWRRFAAFQATMDETALQNKNAILGDMIKTADDQTKEAYKGILQSRTATKKYDISNGVFGIGKDELYQGTIFVPVKSNYAAAAMSSGQGMTLEDVTDMDMKAQGYDEEKAASYKPGYKLSDLENE